MSRPDRPRTLAVRLDSDGDVLLVGPALRAIAAGSSRLDLLVSPSGAAAAHLLPGVQEVLVFDAPWTGHHPPEVEPARFEDLMVALTDRAYDEMVIFTSFHQSALPMALLARLAGVRSITAMSEDYPGSLLDKRARRMADGAEDTGGPDGGHEVEAALRLAEEAGFPLPAGDDRRLRIRPVPAPEPPLPGPYVVVHARASVPSRSLEPTHAAGIVRALRRDGWQVVVTGSSGQQDSVSHLDRSGALDLVGGTSFAQLAGVLAGACCAVVVNTGPAHLAAAVGTPVVSLFSPVVPVERWGPWQVPSVVLGDQQAPCRLTRARDCPTPGHPCLGGVDPELVVSAVRQLVGIPTALEHSVAAGSRS